MKKSVKTSRIPPELLEHCIYQAIMIFLIFKDVDTKWLLLLLPALYYPPITKFFLAPKKVR